MPLDVEVKLGEQALEQAIRVSLAEEGLEVTGDVRWGTATIPGSTNNERENTATVPVRTAIKPGKPGSPDAKAFCDLMLEKAVLEGMHSMLETILADEKQDGEGILNTVARLQRELETRRRAFPFTGDTEEFKEEWAAWLKIRDLLWEERGDEDHKVDGVGGVSLIRFQRLLDEVRRYRETPVAHGAPTREPEKPKTGTAELLNALEMKAFFEQLPEAPERTQWMVRRADPLLGADGPNPELLLVVHNGDPDDGKVLVEAPLTIFPTQSATYAVARNQAQQMLKTYAANPEIHPPDPNAAPTPKSDGEDKLAHDPEWQKICADMGSPLETPDEPHVTDLVDEEPDLKVEVVMVPKHVVPEPPAEMPTLDAVEKTRRKMREGMARGASKIRDRATEIQEAAEPQPAPTQETMEQDFPAN